MGAGSPASVRCGISPRLAPSAYASIGSLLRDDGPLQSVAKPPGSISVTWMPKPATSCDNACEKPSSPHFEAW